MPGRRSTFNPRKLGIVAPFGSIDLCDRTVVPYTKYITPTKAEDKSQASLIDACALIEGFQVPTWNFEMMRRSSMMLTANLTELMISGTSGLSSDLVALDTAVSIAELRHWKELKRTYIKLALRVPAGTNPSAKVAADETKMMLSSNPSNA